MRISYTLAATAAAALFAGAALAEPTVVEGPGHNSECFAPWSEDVNYLQWEAKEGPFRVAVVNGFVGNLWRIQMIQTAKAYVEQPEVAAQISDFRAVSTGNDAPAQLGAIEDFINQDYDIIVVNAVSPEGFDRVIRLADRAGTIIVPFDNTLDTDKVLQVNEDQFEMGRQWGEFLVAELNAIGKTSGRILEVQGVPGNSVNRDRTAGTAQGLADAGGDWEVISVQGMWDDGTAQKVTADAIAVHGEFDAIVASGGDNGIIQALKAADHPWVPFAGESENGFRKAIAEFSDEGLKGLSIGQSPGLVAIAIKAGIAAAQGNVMPQLVSVPLPQADYTTLVDGENYWSDLPDNFFTVNEFPPCDVNINAIEIMAQTEDDS